MSAGDRFFVDTNVLLYSLDSVAPEKQRAAGEWLEALWESGGGRVSWQVLHEFYVNATRKLGVPVRTAKTVVESMASWQPVDMSLGTVQRAWHWVDSAKISYWDSLIVAAAEREGCTWLLTEDFQEGRKFDSVTVISPFQVRPEDFSGTPRRRH